MMGDRIVKGVRKHFKGATVKELVCSLRWSIPMMRLTPLGEDTSKYLLYSFLSIQFVMGKPLILLDILLTLTKTTEDWVKRGLRLAKKALIHYGKLPETY